MTELNGINVLIAEDDFLVRQLLNGLLVESGYTVVGEAHNGREAVEKMREFHPDVILMDIKMPEMDGIEATRAIWKERPTPVVILSAYDIPELVEDAAAAGVGAYLTKPPQRGDIYRAIQVSVARFKDFIQLRNQNQALETVLSNIKSLNGIIHICANCKQVHDEDGKWMPIELYVEQYSDVSFSHGLCPDCAELLYPQYFKKQ